MPSTAQNLALSAPVDRARVTHFLNECRAQRPAALVCHVDLEPRKLYVLWPQTRECMELIYGTETFEAVAQATMSCLAANIPAVLTSLDVELPSLRPMLATGLALPHLATLIVRFFEEALNGDTGERGAAGGAPRLRTVELIEETAVEDNTLTAWRNATNLRAWVAHLGAPRAAVSITRIGGHVDAVA
ncbi:hypothetical protein AURDEDRAFT_175887 [Auricularia subglabra TFB-10046 SS5]|uniref:Uncharacterized protein n=1 Tax=Auricularia subglabra (strain TFB-10046 / SS5) TaxID=717982 RepID=J0WSD3_AURST|nr:hypothetical protein AURDEDRAFT_175887 [Auricularia subglabra TFB-10046 SS5]